MKNQIVTVIYFQIDLSLINEFMADCKNIDLF